MLWMCRQGVGAANGDDHAMLSADTKPATSVLVTITSPDGTVESFASTPADGMLVALDDWQWLRQDDGSWHCDA